MQTTQTLAGLLAPYRPSAISEAVGRTRQAVAAWRLGQAVPDVQCLPQIAKLLRLELGELTAIVAADADRIRKVA